MTPHSRAIAATFGLLVAAIAPSGAAEDVSEVDGPEIQEVLVEAPDEETPSSDESVADDSTNLEALAFPELRYRDGLRINFQSQFLPEADVGPGHVSLYQPDLRVRMNIPISESSIVRVSARGGMSSYQFRGGSMFQSGGADLVGESLDLYRLRLGAQGAKRLNSEGGFWFSEEETWALLTSLVADSKFESDVFSDALSIGTGLALGYEIDDTVRLALGASVGYSPDSGDIDVGPLATFRWNVTDRITIRDRGLGLQAEYRWSPQLEVFAGGFRTSDSYRLNNRAGFELSFRDRQVLVGAGFEWKLTRYLRLNAEAGAVAWRKIHVSDEDLGTLVSQKADPGAYIDIRLEIRPSS